MRSSAACIGTAAAAKQLIYAIETVARPVPNLPGRWLPPRQHRGGSVVICRRRCSSSATPLVRHRP